jgi:hypothetical protein
MDVQPSVPRNPFTTAIYTISSNTSLNFFWFVPLTRHLQLLPYHLWAGVSRRHGPFNPQLDARLRRSRHVRSTEFAAAPEQCGTKHFLFRRSIITNSSERVLDPSRPDEAKHPRPLICSHINIINVGRLLTAQDKRKRNHVVKMRLTRRDASLRICVMSAEMTLASPFRAIGARGCIGAVTCA